MVPVGAVPAFLTMLDASALSIIAFVTSKYWPPLLVAIAVGGLMVLILAWRAGVGAASLPVFFLLIHLAYLRGLWHAVKGERYVTWKPRSG